MSVRMIVICRTCLSWISKKHEIKPQRAAQANAKSVKTYLIVLLIGSIGLNSNGKGLQLIYKSLLALLLLLRASFAGL